MAGQTNEHKWKFFKYGGTNQVNIETSQDLKNLENLDAKLWAVLTCPLSNLEFDDKTLQFIDSDQDKRIKITEIIDAVKWVCLVLKNPIEIAKGDKALPLSSINTETPEGAALLESAKQILKNIGKENASHIELSDVTDTAKIFAATAFNGDGVITCDSSDDNEVRRYIADIIECEGKETDRSGKDGVSEALLDKFISDLKAYSAWKQEGLSNKNEIFFAGDKTPELALAYTAVKDKINDYFTRSALSRFDSGYLKSGQLLEQEYVSMLKKNLSDETPELQSFAIAMISGDMALHLFEKVNPAWRKRLSEFHRLVKDEFSLGDVLSEKQWALIMQTFAPYEQWLAKKAGACTEKLGEQRIRELLDSPHEKAVRELIHRDKALEPRFIAMENVEKLIRYYQNLFTLLNNFVALKDFYDTEAKAIFQIGTMYIDGRSCELCIRVDDIAKHSAFAASSSAYLAYCACKRLGGSETMNLAVAITDGDSDQIVEGRHGLFLDRKGLYWDAVIKKIIDNPVSIRQAFWAPYKKLGKFINEQITKFASEKEKSAGEMLSAGIASLPSTPQTATPTVGFDAGKFAGIFAAVGLGLAAVGSAAASIISGFMALSWWQIPLALIGIVLLISGPSMLIAALKLRKRNLGAVLDANGWAINTRGIINVSFGNKLTRVAKLPKNSVFCFQSPFEHKQPRWKSLLKILIIVALAAAVFSLKPVRKAIVSGLVKITHPLPAKDIFAVPQKQAKQQ